MTDLFSIDNKDLINLRRFFVKAPKQFNRAAAMTLNSMAFGNRKESLNIIDDKMHVRSESFIKGSMRVQMAKANVPINKNQSEFGSLKRPRFTGLVEQETGKKSKKTRTATLLSRKGSEQGKIAPSARMKRGKNFLSPREFISGKNDANRIAAFISHIRRKNIRAPFIIHRQRKRFKNGGKMFPGLYRFRTKKKIVKLQSFSKKQIRPKRQRWLTTGRLEYNRKTDHRKVWAKSLKKTLKFK